MQVHEDFLTVIDKVELALIKERRRLVSPIVVVRWSRNPDIITVYVWGDMYSGYPLEVFVRKKSS